MTGRSIQKLNEMIESQKEEICRVHQGDEQLRRDQQLLHEQLLKQNWDLREAHEKSLNEMEELKILHLMQLRGENWSKVETLSLNSQARFRNYKMNNCMNDSRDFQDAESVRSGQSHVASQPVFFPPHPDPGGRVSRSLGMSSRRGGPPDIWDTHGISGNVFADPVASSPASYPQELNPWSCNVSEHTSPHGMSDSQNTSSGSDDASQDRQPEIQSSLVREIFQRIMGQTNNDCRFQIFMLTNSPHQQRSLVGR